MKRQTVESTEFKWGRVKLHILLADGKQPHIRESSTWLASDEGDVHVQTRDVAISGIPPTRNGYHAATQRSVSDIEPHR